MPPDLVRGYERRIEDLQAEIAEHHRLMDEKDARIERLLEAVRRCLHVTRALSFGHLPDHACPACLLRRQLDELIAAELAGERQ